MSQLSNWIALNRQVDTLPPDIARTVLNLIRAFEALIEKLGFNETVTLFDNHLVDYNNPHQVRFSNIGQMTVDSLWLYYPLIGKVVLENEAALQALTDADPTLALEIMRQDILNTDYWYQDGVGPIANPQQVNGVKQNFYTLSDPSPVKKTTPFYQTSMVVWDFLITQGGTLSTTIEKAESTHTSILFSCNVASSGVDRTWSITLNSSVYIDVSADNNNIVATFDPSVYGNLSSGTLTIPCHTGSNTSIAELRGCLSIRPDGAVLYAVSNGVFFSISTTFTTNAPAPVYNQFSLSHDQWDGVSDVTATKVVQFYPLLNDLREIESRLNTI